MSGVTGPSGQADNRTLSIRGHAGQARRPYNPIKIRNTRPALNNNGSLKGKISAFSGAGTMGTIKTDVNFLSMIIIIFKYQEL